MAVVALLLTSLASMSTASGAPAQDAVDGTTPPAETALVPTAPGEITSFSAKAGAESATVVWKAPVDNGSPIHTYLVRAYTNGGLLRTYKVKPTGTAEGTQIFGLRPGETYTFTIAAENEFGEGPESKMTNKVVPMAPEPKMDGATYVPITPCRIVDTREAGGALANREIRDFKVTGEGPAFEAQGGKENGCKIESSALAVEASVTAVSPADSGFFRAWPSGQTMPNATFMNFDKGMDITNTGAITIGEEEPSHSADPAANADPGGDLRVRSFGGPAEYVIDIQGYFIPINEKPSAAGESIRIPDAPILYTPITPCRIVDTREGAGPLGNRDTREYRVTGNGGIFEKQGGESDGCGVPEGSSAVEASITAVSPDDSGFFRAWPSGQSMPNATFMNFDKGMDITNTGAITIADSKDAELQVRNFGGTAEYVIDIQGYYSPFDFDEPLPEAAANADSKAIPATYVAIRPCRIVDTRDTAGPFGNREFRDYQAIDGDPEGAIKEQGGNPDGCDIPLEAKALEASITAVSPDNSGFFRAWPSRLSMPNATFMNFDKGMDITNTGAITISRDFTGEEGASLSAEVTAQLRARNFGGSAEYVIDVQGYFLPINNPA